MKFFKEHPKENNIFQFQFRKILTTTLDLVTLKPTKIIPFAKLVHINRKGIKRASVWCITHCNLKDSLYILYCHKNLFLSFLILQK